METLVSTRGGMACSDSTDGDGVADLVITPDEGGGPRARVFTGSGFTQIADFFATGLARIRSSRTAAGDPGSGTRSRPPTPTCALASAAERSPSNHVARTGLLRVVKRARTAPTSSASSCPSSATR